MGEGIAAEILVVDDERAVRRGVAAILSGAGYIVREAKNGEEALRLFGEARPDLVLLDVMMPKMDGFSVCAAIREVDAAVPVLFLSALGDEESQLKGFGYGADDYIEKTLPAPLFLARVEAALRRTRAAEPSGDFSFGEWRIRAAQRSMRRSTGETAELCDREIALLRLFSSSHGEVLSRDWLVTKLWGSDSGASDNQLSVLVYGLRGKLAAEGRLIRTHRGNGYSCSCAAPRFMV
jgi:DNA-binding response OmpR family regulator